MKFKKSVQGIVEVITFGAIMSVLLTIESDWTLDYLIFAFFHILIFAIGGILLKKYGR